MVFMKSYSVRQPIPENIRKDLAEYSDFLAHMLFHRGITNSSQAKEFFTHSYENLHDPFLLKDMQKAVDRILLAIEKEETIAIYSDYDADGIPAAVILSDFLDKIDYKNYFVYIPHRNKEGFGLNIPAIDIISERGATLIITLDCGITDVEQVKHANSLGIDVIITDHHEVGEVVPKAFAIINPKQKDCSYPEKMLCGSGVVFKLVQAILLTKDFSLPKGWEKTLLDMVGIATLSDMVPLVGENRTFAKFGLTVLRMSKRQGICKLLKKSRIDQRKLSEDDIGFTVAPRINAASRMDAPEFAFKMLKARDSSEADDLVDYLHKINDERKGHVAVMVKEARKRLEEIGDRKEGIIAMGDVKWKPSLLGLAANALCEEFNRPVFLWGRGEGSDLKGSCRSSGVSVVEMLTRMPESVIETFGGHHQAGGFVVKKESVDFLYDELMKIYSTFSEKSAPTLFTDYALSLSHIGESLWKDVEKLSPFGQHNEKPLFFLSQLQVVAVRQFGKKKEHLSLTLRDGVAYKEIEAIAFFKDLDAWGESIKESEKINLVAYLEKNNFANKSSLRLRIVDVSR